MLQCCTASLISTAHKKVIHPSTSRPPKATNPQSSTLGSPHKVLRSAHFSRSVKEQRSEETHSGNKEEFKHLKKGIRAVSQLNLYTHEIGSSRSWHDGFGHSTLGRSNKIDETDFRRSERNVIGSYKTSSRSSIYNVGPKVLSTPSLNSVYRSFPALFTAATAITLPYSNVTSSYNNANSYSRPFNNACSNDTYQMFNRTCL